ncbi:hypothetical protein CCY99_07295 [Helicobacter sp. 16-1353]|uniref:molybdate ABC transporter permease subunit n=1 Tax=Helicobacter sp. 16-1353 TaxID=2004996 RepID=UPI000DCDE1F9|nr:ABC transporter permease subunit [Helicobacter sp. 16-1353]RAX52447.1 hypothetical protein CCY99_07295 [Helicobacter sp. 16-1353]
MESTPESLSTTLESLNAMLESISFAPFWLSLKVGVICVLLYLFVGLLLALYLSRNKGLLATTIDIVVTLPLVFPPIALGYFLLLLLGKNGIFGELNLLFSFEAVVIASFIAGLPLVVKPVESVLGGKIRDLEAVSYTLGKSKIYTFIFVSIPCIYKTLLSSLFLGFARSMGEVGITLLIGGNIVNKSETISLAIYNAVLGAEYNTASFYATILGVICLAIFLFLRFLQKDLNAKGL